MKLLTALACFFLALLHAQAQPISNIRVTLPRQLPANTGEWATLPQPLIISAQAKPVQGRIPPEVMESRVVVTIERGGAKVCGAYTPANAPMSNFTSPVKTWTGAQATGLLGQDCSLPAGDYELCVVFWGTANASIPPKEISEKKCFPFTIAGADTYSPPVLIGPENNKKYRIEELKRPVTFRWTPIVPKPREPVTYRLRVWQLMQGQNANAAMRANQPIVNKDVENLNQAIVTNLLSGPCDPPFICDFVWNVQALDKNGKPMGNNNGTSETWSFAVTQYIIQLDSIKVQCTATPGVYSFSYTITNPNPGTAQLNAFVVTSSTPAGASVGAFAPPIGTSIAPNAQLTITGTVNAAPNLSNICIGAEIRDAVNSFWKASKDTCVPVRPCVCEACNEKNFTFNAPPPQITLNNNNLNYTQPI
ncbi:MAG: hypothetical protein JNM68_12375, partial [Dinghuibacter sp.]|nr:hypothetical protein [Dinghuibacter sp.]